MQDKGSQESKEKDSSHDAVESQLADVSEQKQNIEEEEGEINHNCDIYDVFNGYVNGCILVDLREKKDYDQSHIHSAIQFDANHPENTPIGANTKIMCYNYKHSAQKGDKLLSFSKYCQQTRHCRSFRVTNNEFDYNTFKASFPFLCVSVIEAKRMQDERRKYPNFIVDRVYLGDMWNRKSVEELKALGITHIVDATTDRFPQLSFKILKIKLGDTPNAPIDKYFDETVAFVEDALEDKHNRVFIHCQMGISRSTTLTLVYLMKSLKYTLYDGYKLCQQNRPRIRPNDGFYQRLVEFELKVHGKSTKALIDQQDLRDFSHQECIVM